ncbi:hypothetical protein MD484_g8803, partial [Candolleomyces efflorescens]
MASEENDFSSQAQMFHYAGGDVDMLSDEDTRGSQGHTTTTRQLQSPISLKPSTPGTPSTSQRILAGAFIPPASYQPVTFSPPSSQPIPASPKDAFSIPVSDPTDKSTEAAETDPSRKAAIANALPPGKPTGLAANRAKSDGLPHVPPTRISSIPVRLSGSIDMMAKQEWNLRSLDAVLVSGNFLDNHINDLIWVKSRLLEHQGHLLRCRDFAQRNLDAINRALYIDSKLEEMRSSFSPSTDEES